MCGIAGIWNQNETVNPLSMRRMLAALAHRGPEGAALARFDKEKLVLGFRRLGFTDGGQLTQPMTNGDGTLAIVFNGEIYDHAIMRKELIARGHHFRTATDTEVVLNLYEALGEAFVESLNGEFAFAIWDVRKRSLLLCRDRFGVKPLLYGWHQNQFVFASEAKALHMLPQFNVTLDPNYFAGPGIGVADSSATAFVGIKSVRPGHFVRVQDGHIDEKAYWSPTYGKNQGLGMAEAARAVRQSLERAVSRRLEGDPPIAVSLSSGIDSTAVAALMAKCAMERGRKLTAYSIGYEGAAYDESVGAEKNARALGLDFVRVPQSIDELSKGFLETTYAIETATNSLSNTARRYLMRSVRADGYKAIASGEGSDEIFGGYPYFRYEAILRRIHTAGQESSGRAAFDQFAKDESRSAGVFWKRRPNFDKSQSVFGLSSAYFEHALSTERAAARLFSADWKSARSTTSAQTLSREFDLPQLSREHPFDVSRSIARGILASVIIPGLGDRVEMANSLEGRVPFLDKDVVSLAHSLGEHHCLDPETLVGKRVLKQAMSDVLPIGFKPPPKTTLMSPTFTNMWSTKEGKEILHHLLRPESIKNAGFFDPWAVRATKLAWHATSRSERLNRTLDLLIGWIASTQALHSVFVEDILMRRRNLDLDIEVHDLSPQTPNVMPSVAMEFV